MAQHRQCRIPGVGQIDASQDQLEKSIVHAELLADASVQLNPELMTTSVALRGVDIAILKFRRYHL